MDRCSHLHDVVVFDRAKENGARLDGVDDQKLSLHHSLFFKWLGLNLLLLADAVCGIQGKYSSSIHQPMHSRVHLLSVLYPL